MGNILRFGTGWHSSIPNEFIQNPQNPALSDGAFRLFIVIVSYASPASPQPFPSWHKLSKNTSCCRHSLAKRLKELESRGWISREQCSGDGGKFGHNLYTICPDDDENAQKRKQFLSPSVILPHSVEPHAVVPHAVQQHTKSTNSKENQSDKITTTKRDIGAGGNFASGDRVASPPGPPDKKKETDPGTELQIYWSGYFQQWFKVSYLSRSGEARKAREIIDQLQCKPRDLLAYVFRMWIKTTDFDEVDPKGHDPLFYQIKGSRNLSFFLKYLQDIAVEQKEPLDCAIPVSKKEFSRLEQIIKEGRP